MNGGQLRGIAADVALSPGDFAEELRKQGITAMFLTAEMIDWYKAMDRMPMNPPALAGRTSKTGSAAE